MKKEMEKRNEKLTPEDRQKNLAWAVVGTKGEKRLVKTTVRAQQATGRRATATAIRVPGGGGQAAGATHLPAEATQRERRGSKRGERSEEEEMEVTLPPAKR